MGFNIVRKGNAYNIPEDEYISFVVHVSQVLNNEQLAFVAQTAEAVFMNRKPMPTLPPSTLKDEPLGGNSL